MRSAFDFAPFRRSTVGFDRLFDMLENNSFGQAQENYPPFDLVREGENQYRIQLAVAGFKQDEIDITAQQNVLVVSGRKADEAGEKGADFAARGGSSGPAGRRTALAGAGGGRGGGAAPDRRRRNAGRNKESRGSPLARRNGSRARPDGPSAICRCGR